jgi:hypothetical protein
MEDVCRPPINVPKKLYAFCKMDILISLGMGLLYFKKYFKSDFTVSQMYMLTI